MRSSAAKLRELRKGEKDEYSVRAFSAAKLRLPKFDPTTIPDSVMLGVIPSYYDRGHRDGVSPRLPAKWCYIEETGYLCPVNMKPEEDSEGFSGRLVDQSNIDFDILNHWISFCRENHKKLCKLSEEISLPGFGVIDCYTRHLVSVSIGYSYVVLSYVWVPLLRHFKLPTNNSLPNAGNVIEDSIIVVKKLNLRYLWVDRYCAPQDGEDKHSQIQTMDLIYKNAEVTIIALAGKHSSAGLPGIGRTPRIPQPHIVLGDITLVSSLLSLRTLIKRSVWGRRGWTYQEGGDFKTATRIHGTSSLLRMHGYALPGKHSYTSQNIAYS